MRRCRLPIRLAAFVAVAAALAAGKVGPEFQVNTYTSGDQKLPVVAMRSDGGFVVVWDSGPHPLDPSGRAIIGRRFDAAGNPQSAEFLVNTGTSGDQTDPSVAMNGSDAFVVSWHRVSSHDCAAQRFDASGAPLGAEAQACLATTAANEFASPAHVSMDGAGGFKTLYRNWNFVSQTQRELLYMRTLDASGNQVGTDFQLSTGGHYGRLGAHEAVGEFVVVWGENRLFQGYDYTYGRLFSAQSAPQTNRFHLNNCSQSDLDDEQTHPDATMNRHGEFLVVWERNNDGCTLAAEGGPSKLGGTIEILRAQRFDRNAHKVGAPYTVPFPGAARPRLPRLVGDDEGNYLAVVTDTGPMGTGPMKIQGRVVDRANNLVGSEFTIALSTSLAGPPDVAGAPSGDFVVVWSEGNRDGSGAGIFAQRFCQHPSMESLRVNKVAGGTQLRATWGSVPNAEDYVLYEDTSVAGAFTTVTGTGTNGTTGLTTPMPATNRFYLLSGLSALCGEGTKR